MYDFNTPVPRRGTGALKWNVAENELPMWVADMDFKTAPEVQAAIEKRAAHGIYGYTEVPQAWYDAYCSWWQRRHGLTLDPEGLIFCTGVIPAVSSMVRKLTTPAENVVLLTPVYNIFFNSVLNNGRRVLQCPLQYKNGHYSIDYEDLTAKLADPQTTLFILCNPQNPTGIIWPKEDLKKLGSLCAKFGVTVISDEIHCDLTDPGSSYHPFALAAENECPNAITCLAPTKAFNLAGLQTAAVYVPNKNLRHKVWRALNTDEVAEPNIFAVDAAVAAFTKGEPWLDELCAYVQENKSYAVQFMAQNIPQILPVCGPATYLLWLDCSKIAPGQSSALANHLRQSTGLYLSKGEAYGGNGNSFLRMNLACPRCTLQDGLNRLKAGVAAFASTR